MVFGLRSTAGKDGALLVGSVVASTAVSMVAAPVIALVKARIETLLEFLGIAQSGKSKFIFDFFWGSINGALISAIMSPFRVLSDGHRFATIASLMFDGSEAPGSISEYAAEQYAKGGFAAFCEAQKVQPSAARGGLLEDRSFLPDGAAADIHVAGAHRAGGCQGAPQGAVPVDHRWRLPQGNQDTRMLHCSLISAIDLSVRRTWSLIPRP